MPMRSIRERRRPGGAFPLRAVLSFVCSGDIPGDRGGYRTMPERGMKAAEILCDALSSVVKERK